MSADSPPPSDPTGTAGPALGHQVIAERARALWVERGCPGGRDLEHWLEAERQLREEYALRHRSTPTAEGRDLEEEDIEAEKRLDGLIEEAPSPARRTPAGEQL